MHTPKWIAIVAAAGIWATACAPALTPTPTSAPRPTAPVQATLLPTVVATETPDPAAQGTSLFGQVAPDDWQTGPADARLTIIEYGEYQCQYCAKIAPVLVRLLKKYPDDVRFVFRHFPLEGHDKSLLAAEAAEAAGAQGKFWVMHDLLYTRYEAWAPLSPEDFRARLGQYAKEIDLDTTQFTADLDSGKFAQKVKDAAAAATHIKLADGTVTSLPGTPFFLVNEQPYQGPPAFWAFDALVKLELLRDRQFARPEEVIDPLKHYQATLHTAKGDIVLELYADRAPITVNNFVFLAQKGWYDGVTFHRVLPGFVAQAGDPTGTGFGGPGYYIPNEIVPDLKFDAAGVVAMANSGPDTNGSQFFITLAAAPNLDGHYTIFGRVARGMDVVNALTPRDPQIDPEAPDGDAVLSVTIEEK